jgi:multidrug efflux pump subunit AcrA (membrane-fusion protein)
LGDDPNAGKAKGTGPEARAIIPASAVRKEGAASVVYLVNQKKLERHTVTLGATRGSDVEIMAGLSPGDSVVLRGAENLHDGQTVEVKQ